MSKGQTGNEKEISVRSFSVSTYRTQWPRAGAVLSLAIGGVSALWGRKMSKPQLLTLLNFGALLLHQFEEYEFPGYFPGQLNRGLCHSDSPRNYPLNTNSSMWINTIIAYPAYIAPAVFPEKKSLGLGTVFFGIGQAVFHGIVFPRRARIGESKYTYAPGALTAILLHVPLGIAYVRAVQEDGPISRSDWGKGFGCLLAFAILGVAAPIVLLRDKQSPDAFTEAQMGPYGSGKD